MNSHVTMVGKYRRMLDEKKTISSPDSRRLTVEQALKVLDA
jgi:uncharacterized protein YfbU (UPF0304 family)